MNLIKNEQTKPSCCRLYVCAASLRCVSGCGGGRFLTLPFICTLYMSLLWLKWMFDWLFCICVGLMNSPFDATYTHTIAFGWHCACGGCLTASHTFFFVSLIFHSNFFGFWWENLFDYCNILAYESCQLVEESSCCYGFSSISFVFQLNFLI